MTIDSVIKSYAKDSSDPRVCLVVDWLLELKSYREAQELEYNMKMRIKEEEDAPR